MVLVAVVVFGALILQALNPKPKESAGWALGLPLPLERGETASTVLDGKLVVVGGLRGLTTVSNEVTILDTESGRWRTGGTLPPLHHAAAAAVGGVVYVSGGARSVTDWTPTDDLRGFVLGKTAIGGATKMPEGRQGHAMVALHDKLYIVGGVGETDRTLICDIKKKKWTFGAPLPYGRDHLRAVVRGGQIWAIGGRDGAPTTHVDVYDPKRDVWLPGPALPEPMSAMAVGVLGHDIHVVGSEDPRPLRGGVSGKHYVLRLKSDRWETAAPPPLPVHGAAYGVIGGKLVIVGGASRNGALSVISWTNVMQIFG